MFSSKRSVRFLSLNALLLLPVAGLPALRLSAQTQVTAVSSLRPVAQKDRIGASSNLTSRVQLHGHLPGWVSTERQIAKRVDLSSPLDLTVTLRRDPAVQAAFEKLLADQQDSSSAMYHQWLTPEQIGELYGPTQNDVNAVSKWLSSQGYAIRSVTPSRMQIHVSGTVATASNAFRTSFAYFQSNELQRLSAVSEPYVPAAIAPVILSITGLSEVLTVPQHTMSPVPVASSSNGRRVSTSLRGGSALSAVRSDDEVSPQYSNGTTHYTFASDFAKIYDLPAGNTGATIGSAAQHIAIIGRSRVTTNDAAGNAGINGFSSYRLNQIVVPASAGGSDPGTTSAGDRSEATLDVARTITSANGAITDLVVSATTNGTDGVYLATSYQINTVRDPIMTISFGACEYNGGSGSVNTYDTLFSQAAAQGISVLVSSGDSGAAGCDAAFSAPPASQIKSQNFICSSSYATCVGGTEFNDTASPTTYWAGTNSSTYESALSYIPEGAWNEPVNSSGSYVVVGTGGGVSSYITKPSWQTGTGVPADGYRDTPDVAFTAANHDGYYVCYTATAANCNVGYIFSGTSAAAPGMAAITALLNTQVGTAQGNLNPILYRMAATTPSAFHDVTVASSGVTSCDIGTPSMCNNSTPGSASSLTGGLAGYLVTTGYDQATGLGSLDVTNFLNAVSAATPKIEVISPTLKTGATAYITAYITWTGTPAPTGAVTFLVNGSSANVSGMTCVTKGIGTGAPHINCTASYSAASVAAGNYTLQVTEAADSNYPAATGTGFVTVTP